MLTSCSSLFGLLIIAYFEFVNEFAIFVVCHINAGYCNASQIGDANGNEIVIGLLEHI